MKRHIDPGARIFRVVQPGLLFRLVLPICFCGLLLMVLSGEVSAQLPKSPLDSLYKRPEAAPQPQISSITAQRAQISPQLAKAEETLKQLSAPPAGISSSKFDELRSQLDSLITRQQALLSTISELEEARQARKDLEKKAASWTGFTDKPPYSILKSDELSEATANASLRISGLDSSRQIFRQEAQRLQETVKLIEAQLRESEDAMVRQESAAGKAVAAWDRDIISVRRQSAMTAATWALKRAEVTEERLSLARAELDLLERQVMVMRPRVRFSKADLAGIQGKIDADRARLDRELEANIINEARSSRQLDKAEKDLADFRLTGSPAGVSKKVNRDKELLEARVRLAGIRVENSRYESELLAALISVNQGLSKLWETRYEAYNRNDSTTLNRARSTFRDGRKRLQAWLEYARRQLEIARSNELEQNERLGNIDSRSPLLPVERDILAALDQRKRNTERFYLTFGNLDIKLQQWLDETETQQKTRSLSQRIRDMFSAMTAFGGKVWRLELFAVDDTVEIGGQKMTTSRGVTVGKSIGALLLFLVGYLLAAYVSRRMKRVLVTRFGVGEQQARVLRRWMLALTGFILLVITLNLVRIPLSVFAFLGGALAIGVGFGTQTLIKNFISGILILLERKVQVGDIVHVDGILGRVTVVDLRASTVLGFDGVETLIPNATFVEQKVTNWTHSDKRQRRTLRVGVAYGSNLDLVRGLLHESAVAHGLVLSEPEPMILFEDFGDNTLIFSLRYWLDLGTGINPDLIASDLRFMIEKRFTDSGIVMAFPQRDVHLLSEFPLKVELSDSTLSESEAPMERRKDSTVAPTCDLTTQGTDS